MQTIRKVVATKRAGHGYQHTLRCGHKVFNNTELTKSCHCDVCARAKKGGRK
jgi:hypothetical protein